MNIQDAQNTVVVRSSKNNTYYKNLKVQTEDPKIKNLLKEHKINLVEDMSGQENDFNMHIYGLNGMLYSSLNKFNNFEEILSIYTSANSHLNNLQSGGKIKCYKHKYLKYKSKYLRQKTKIGS